jgi:hypothetical protein
MNVSHKVFAARRSMTVFVCGLASFVPVLGLPFGITALVGGAHVRREYRGFNPGELYLNWGMALALIGMCSSTLIAGAVAFQIINNQ